MARLTWLFLLPAIALLHLVSSSAAAMAPAFIWSNSRFLGTEDHSVDYQIFTPKSLIDNLFESSFEKQETTEKTNLFLVFIGHELRLADIAHNRLHEIDTLHLLKNTVASSNFSVVLPHVHFSSEEKSFMDALVETIQQTEKPGNFLGELQTFECTGASKSLEEFGSIQEIEVFLTSRKVTNGRKTDVLVICGSSLKLTLKAQSEGKLLGRVLQALSIGVRDYIAFYVSDLSGRSRYDLDLQFRQLSSSAGATNETFCDEICQTKATLLEVLFVGIVLIFILVIGICCMAGVQSPSRFEAPKES
ncbi:hypothetical protein O6H91_04G109600 [Diphasiastrum complanatum]|uniref:Uncharacterized protein n=2 Tax=Diphasiastrum complanatum TaxID=34168 RepID=A0ACC2E0D8_DIPCM|nr:hypothetical protein O6H91_04G109600 [Diphasiastrum complanatum]KAJ7559981.1 hypothetical protein O6H91_04G109600 [Diphasiastrum complanatum]